MLDVSDEQLERMKVVDALQNAAFSQKKEEWSLEMSCNREQMCCNREQMWEQMLLDDLANDPDTRIKEIRYQQAREQLAVMTDSGTIGLLNLSIQNELRLRNNLSLYVLVD